MATFNNVSEHENICKELNALYSAKNHDYGDSFGKTRSIVPDSILVRLHDKLSRLDSLLMAPEDAKVKDESIDDTLMDLANYAIMELVERRRDKAEETDEALYSRKLQCDFMTKDEKVEFAKSLRGEGYTLEQIAKIMGYTSDDTGRSMKAMYARIDKTVR